MKNNYELQHKVAKLNPYKSVVKVFDVDADKTLVGIKNVSSIPNTLMKKLEKVGYALHTIDKKSQLAGRAVDTELINPITGNYMSGSSSGTAINVFAGINDIGIGNDGGGSVLAPAICVNIYGFISKLIESDRINNDKKLNTDGMVASNSIGFMSRKKELLYQTIYHAIGVEPGTDYGVVYSDAVYENIDTKVIPLMNSLAPRNELTTFLMNTLKSCDVLMLKEGPIDVHGFGDSLFGHFDELTKKIQEDSNKGYVRVCNIANATTLSIPQKELGTSILIMCENNPTKVAKLLYLGNQLEEINDELIERYFLDLNNYFIDEYEV